MCVLALMPTFNPHVFLRPAAHVERNTYTLQVTYLSIRALANMQTYLIKSAFHLELMCIVPQSGKLKESLFSNKTPNRFADLPCLCCRIQLNSKQQASKNKVSRVQQAYRFILFAFYQTSLQYFGYFNLVFNICFFIKGLLCFGVRFPIS